MSKYVDRFIKQHKEYFKRNESFIDNNSWNKSEYEDDVKDLTTELAELTADESISKKDKQARISQIKKTIGDIGKDYQQNKTNLFIQENKLTDGIVGRLSAFIKETEKIGERNKNKKVQNFINFTADIIYKHIKKCDDYLDYNMNILEDNGEEDYEIEYKGQEITFQDTIFNEKIGIQDKLEGLNISGDIENMTISFYKDQKASIPMIDVLPLYNTEIRQLTDKLKLPTEVKDTEFFLHKVQRGDKIPEWDEKKHYWEQDKKTLSFWYNEWLKIKKGYTLDGYFMHPWLYYHLNFYKTPIPQKDGTEPTINPYLRDNEWYIAELLKKAEEVKNRGICIFGSRRFSKALRDDQILYYEDGTKKAIGDSSVGDKIFGGDGKVTTITGVYPQGEVQLYEVELQDGRKSICCDEHLWGVYNKNNTYRALPLKEIRRKMTKTNPFSVPLAKPINYNRKNFNISPYAIGYMIGDGGLTQSVNISFTPEDEEELKSILKKELSNYDVRFAKTQESRWSVKNSTDLRKEIKNLKLNKPSWEKFIPEDYKTGSIEQRFELIQGLLDSDGCVSQNKSGNGKIKSNISFCTTSEILAKDFREVCNTLGIVTSLHSRQRYRKGKLNRVAYEVIVKSDDERFFKLNRKKSKIIKRINGNPDKIRIVNITKIGKEKATCIKVDNQDKLFLTNDAIVTHNSVSMSSICDWKALIKSNASTSITSGSTGDLNELTHKIRTSMKFMEPAFKLPIQKQEWDGGVVELGLKADAQTLLEHSRHTIKNLDAGKKNSSQKTAGGAPSVFLIEEIGKMAWEKAYLAAIPSFETPYGFKTTVIAVGCVCAGTKVWTNKGELVNIEDLTKSQGILGYDGKGVSKEPITWMKPPEKKECVRITTNSGDILECSIDHPILMSTKEEASKNSYFKRADSLKKEDVIFKIKVEGECKTPINGDISFQYNEDYPKGRHFKGKKTQNLTPSSVLKIEMIGEQDVYNLTAGKTNTYLANGFITHNTSGESSLSGDAMRAVSDPTSFKFLEMDWDLLENTIEDKEAITWKRRRFASFVPGQMGYKTGFKRIEKGFGDFLGIDSEELNKIKILQTDWKTNTKVIQDDRKAVEKDPLKHQQEVIQYPIDPEECFLSTTESPFAPILMDAKKHKEYLIEKQEGKRGYFVQKEDGVKEFDISNKPLAEYPHSGGFIDAPGVLYEDLPEVQPPPYLYIAGFDDYKQEESGTDSVGSFHIYKVNIGMDKWCGRIVYSLSTRPDPWTKMYRQMLMAMQAFNAQCFMENADLGFKQYLDRKKITDRWLVASMDFTSDMQIKYGGKRKYGWAPTQANKKFLFKLLVQYCREEIELEMEDGSIKTITGVQRINDIGLLEEIITYSEDKNVDRVTSFMSCLGYEFYLDQNYMFPKSNKQNRERQDKMKKQQKQTFGQRMFGNRTGGGFF